MALRTSHLSTVHRLIKAADDPSVSFPIPGAPVTPEDAAKGQVIPAQQGADALSLLFQKTNVTSATVSVFWYDSDALAWFRIHPIALDNENQIVRIQNLGLPLWVRVDDFTGTSMRITAKALATRSI